MQVISLALINEFLLCLTKCYAFFMGANESLKIEIKDPILERGTLPSISFPNGIQELNVYFDKHVTFNSVGIREWISWISPISKNTNIKLNLFKCPVNLMNQMNLLNGFMPKQAIIQSFYIPFTNEDATESDLILCRRGKDFDQNNIKIDYPIDSKGQKMILDVNLKNYLKCIGVDRAN